MAGEVRRQRLQEAFRAELSKLIHTEMKDPRIGFVSVTGVLLSRDLSQAKVYVSILGEQEDKDTTMKVLGRAKNFLRGEVGRRIRLRHTPELVLLLDESIERGVRLKGMLDDLKSQEGRGEEESGDISGSGRDD